MNKRANSSKGLRYGIEKILPSGERRVRVYSHGTLLDYWINLYLLRKRRPKVKARTIETEAVALIMLRRWAERNGFSNFESELVAGRILTPDEISSLAECANEPERTKKKVTRMTVSRNLYRSRLTTIERYCLWLMDIAAIGLAQRDSSYREIKAAKDLITDQFAENRGGRRTFTSNAAKEGMTATEVKRLLEVLDPENKDNPWKQLEVRLRNRAMILTELSLALRSGELLGLYDTDLKLIENQVYIFRRVDNPEDPRQNPAKQKTRERVFEISNALALILNDYLSIRRKTGKAKNQPFLWVAHKEGRNLGGPLSYASVSQIYASLREVEGIPKNITSHLMRHTCASNLRREMMKNGVNADEGTWAINEFMGHAPHSKVGAVYQRAIIKETARDIAIANQNALFNGEWGGVKDAQ